MQLLRDIYVIDGPCFGTISHIFAIKYANGIVLIDAGVSGRSEACIQERLGYWGLSEEDITHVLLTHGHWDHVGCAAYFREKGAKIIAHKNDVTTIEAGGPDADNPFDHQFFPPCKVDLALGGDERLTIGGLNVDAIHVPGHTPGSMIYQLKTDAKTVWFSGDFLIPDSIPPHQIKVWWPGDVDFDAKSQLSSHRKIWRSKPDVILGGHGYLLLDCAQNVPKIAYQNALLNLQTR